MIIYNCNTSDMVIEITKEDKWWLKIYIEKSNIDLENMENIEISFFKDKEKEYYYPSLLFDEDKVDWIEQYSSNTVKEILNSKSRVRNRFYYTFL